MESGAPCLLSNLLSLRKSHIIPRDPETPGLLGLGHGAWGNLPVQDSPGSILGRDQPGGKNLRVSVSTVTQVLLLL